MMVKTNSFNIIKNTQNVSDKFKDRQCQHDHYIGFAFKEN